MSDTIIASLIAAGGVGLGSLITLLGLCVQSVLQTQREQVLHLKRKREELYIKACNILMEHEKYRREHKWPQSCKDMFNDLQGPMMIYASKAIYDEYYKLDREICHVYDKIRSKRQIDIKSNEMADKIEAFATKMRSELGIKGAL